MVVCGMKWHQHIFGDSKEYKSLGQFITSRKLKKIGKTSGKNSRAYKKLKAKLKSLRKRDSSGYKKFLDDQKAKKEKQTKEKEIKKINNQTTDRIKMLSDNDLQKQINRLKMENDYYNTKKIYDRYKSEYGKSTTRKVLETIGKKVLEPALTEAGKEITTDLLKKLGFSTNDRINKAYNEAFGKMDANKNKIEKAKEKAKQEARKSLQDKEIEKLDKELENLNKNVSILNKKDRINELKKIIEERKKK
jgi:hypothetical protein